MSAPTVLGRSARPGEAGQAPHADRAMPRRPRRRRAASGTPAVPFFAATLLAAATVLLGVFAAQPIYETPRLWLVGGLTGAVAFALVALGVRLRWGAFTLVPLLAALVLLVVPLCVPQAAASGPAGLVRGLGDGLAAVALGWKQLLTLALPVGEYQTVLVPFFVTIGVSVSALAALALRSVRTAPLAALPLLAPVLFGTVFGASSVSDPVRLGGFTLVAPRELATWLVASGIAAVWIAWASGIERRRALRRGRLAEAEGIEAVEAEHGVDSAVATGIGATRTGASGRGAVRRNAALRGLIAAATVVAALVAAVLLAPVLDPGSRTVPRDRIDPEIIVREQVSPLASYRVWKRDDALDTPLFTVTSDDALPARLRLSVLESYDGVDFFVGSGSTAGGDVGRFARFPSGGAVEAPVDVSIAIEAGYSDIWVPLAPPLASPPTFGGERASDLADSFYLNREAGSAVAVPTVEGLRAGDTYRATMSAAADAAVGERPISANPLIDIEQMPQLQQWLKTQELAATGDGLVTAIERLRSRGYLSHSLTHGDGESLWLQRLAAEHGTSFVTSAGGHTAARIEQLFEQLNEQESAAGDNPPAEMLVSGIGDDEQFATAAALIARAMGFESRVVLGVRLGGADAGVPGVPACAETCTGEHVSAWVEVRGADGVWAALDATPQVDVPPSMLEKGEQLPEFPTAPEERDATESDPPVGMSEQESGNTDDPGADLLAALWPVLRGVGLGLLALVLLALPLLFLPLAKRLRQRRRAAQRVPELRALGQWDRLIDDFADAGAPIPDGSRRDVAESLGVTGGEWIAWTVDRAVYSHEGISEGEADRLEHAVDAELANRRASRGLWARVRAAYSLRSLGVRASARSAREARNGGAR